MSSAGIVQYKENLDKLTSSESFRNASEGDRLKMGRALLNSKYGSRRFGKVEKLPTLRPL
jgi:hypothetical protein